MIRDKLNLLLKYIKTLEKVAVAFSGGVDSTFLLKCAAAALGKDNVIALTAVSPLIPGSETREAAKICEGLGVGHMPFSFDILGVEDIAGNPKDRCYLCKRELFLKMTESARNEGVYVVIEGSNIDDEGDYRPGLKALSELGIKSPLRELGFTKSEIRQLSAELGLKTSEKPSMACLATRIPYGERLTAGKLSMVEAAEELLFDIGFRQVRVRMHGEKDFIARIEVAAEELKLLLTSEIKNRVVKGLKDIGFAYVSADLEGYRTGSMNEVLEASSAG